MPRLSMLETVREYGWERLIERQEAEESQRMHALYYLALAEEAALHLREGGQQIQWLGRLAAEQENLRAVLTFLIEHKEADLAVRLSTALRWYWVTRGSFCDRGDPSADQSAQAIGLDCPGSGRLHAGGSPRQRTPHYRRNHR